MFFFPHKGRGLTGPKFNLQHVKDHGHTGSIINNSHHLLVGKKTEALVLTWRKSLGLQKQLRHSSQSNVLISFFCVPFFMCLNQQFLTRDFDLTSKHIQSPSAASDWFELPCCFQTCVKSMVTLYYFPSGRLFFLPVLGRKLVMTEANWLCLCL